MDYKKALLKGKEDPTDLLITATTLNFLRMCDQYKITLEDICEDIDKISESIIWILTPRRKNPRRNPTKNCLKLWIE